MADSRVTNGVPHLDGDDLDKGPPGTDPHQLALDKLHLNYSPSTLAVHADDSLNTLTDVAPPIHVSTTYRYPPNPDDLHPFHERGEPRLAVNEYCYSRESTHSSARLEHILSSLLHAPCITYSSGLAAFHALLTFLNPKRVAIGAGYHGCHGTLELHTRLTGAKILPLDCPASDLNPGDLLHLETPVNPTGLTFNIEHYASIAHSRGAYLSVDATFGPPPLQDPFKHGADVVMHSGTKYIGGHSDLLCGVLAVKHKEWIPKLLHDRLVLGSVMGGLEAWLGIRSTRTLELRVLRQSSNATKIVSVLQSALTGSGTKDHHHLSEQDISAVQKVIKTVHHASVQPAEDQKWLRHQMPHGYGPVFALVTHTPDQARRLPSHLDLFHHATSLGGVESLIEWRTMTDNTVGKDVLRVSIGVEDVGDLVRDLLAGIRAVAAI